MALRSRSGAESSYAPTADLSPKSKRYLPKKVRENMGEEEREPRRKARGLAKGQAARLETDEAKKARKEPQKKDEPAQGYDVMNVGEA